MINSTNVWNFLEKIKINLMLIFQNSVEKGEISDILVTILFIEIKPDLTKLQFNYTIFSTSSVQF